MYKGDKEFIRFVNELGYICSNTSQVEIPITHRHSFKSKLHTAGFDKKAIKTIGTWAKERVEKFHSKNPHCHYCHQMTYLNVSSKSKVRATLDHKIPLSKGGKDIATNSLLSCYKCNNIKSSMDYNDFIELLKTCTVKKEKLSSRPPLTPKFFHGRYFNGNKKMIPYLRNYQVVDIIPLREAG
jgi:hypothetical protein